MKRNSLFPLQGFFSEGFKSSLHFFQTVSGESGCFLRLIDFIPPVLAFVLITQVIIVFPGSFIKFTLVLERLFFAAFIAAKLIPLAFGKEYFPTDFTFSEIESPNAG